jgi:hypothetical protein
MIAELTGIGCSGEVAGKESDSDRDPATKLPRSRGYIYETLGLNRHTILPSMNRA